MSRKTIVLLLKSFRSSKKRHWCQMKALMPEQYLKTFVSVPSSTRVLKRSSPARLGRTVGTAQRAVFSK